jgi:hypothetical protein
VRDEREALPSPPEVIRFPLTRAELKREVEEEVANDPGVLLGGRFLQPLAMPLTPRQAAKLRLSMAPGTSTRSFETDSESR